MNYAIAARVAVWGVVALWGMAFLRVAILEVKGFFDRKRALRDELETLLQRERVARQRRLLRLADEIEALPEHEKQRLQREAEALGFLDPADSPRPLA